MYGMSLLMVLKIIHLHLHLSCLYFKRMLIVSGGYVRCFYSYKNKRSRNGAF